MKAYWRHHLCKNPDCGWSWRRAGASDEAAERFKRKMWRRAVEGKGKLHGSIEKVLSQRGFKTVQGM